MQNSIPPSNWQNIPYVTWLTAAQSAKICLSMFFCGHIPPSKEWAGQLPVVPAAARCKIPISHLILRTRLSISQAASSVTKMIHSQQAIFDQESVSILLVVFLHFQNFKLRYGSSEKQIKCLIYASVCVSLGNLNAVLKKKKSGNLSQLQAACSLDPRQVFIIDRQTSDFSRSAASIYLSIYGTWTHHKSFIKSSPSEMTSGIWQWSSVLPANTISCSSGSNICDVHAVPSCRTPTLT